MNPLEKALTVPDTIFTIYYVLVMNDIGLALWSH